MKSSTSLKNDESKEKLRIPLNASGKQKSFYQFQSAKPNVTIPVKSKINTFLYEATESTTQNSFVSTETSTAQAKANTKPESKLEMDKDAVVASKGAVQRSVGDTKPNRISSEFNVDVIRKSNFTSSSDDLRKFSQNNTQSCVAMVSSSSQNSKSSAVKTRHELAYQKHLTSRTRLTPSNHELNKKDPLVSNEALTKGSCGVSNKRKPEIVIIDDAICVEIKSQSRIPISKPLVSKVVEESADVAQEIKVKASKSLLEKCHQFMMSCLQENLQQFACGDSNQFKGLLENIEKNKIQQINEFLKKLDSPGDLGDQIITTHYVRELQEKVGDYAIKLEEQSFRHEAKLEEQKHFYELKLEQQKHLAKKPIKNQETQTHSEKTKTKEKSTQADSEELTRSSAELKTLKRQLQEKDELIEKLQIELTFLESSQKELQNLRELFEEQLVQVDNYQSQLRNVSRELEMTTNSLNEANLQLREKEKTRANLMQTLENYAKNLEEQSHCYELKLQDQRNFYQSKLQEQQMVFEVRLKNQQARTQYETTKHENLREKFTQTVYKELIESSEELKALERKQLMNKLGSEMCPIQASQRELQNLRKLFEDQLVEIDNYENELAKIRNELQSTRTSLKESKNDAAKKKEQSQRSVSKLQEQKEFYETKLEEQERLLKEQQIKIESSQMQFCNADLQLKLTAASLNEARAQLSEKEKTREQLMETVKTLKEKSAHDTKVIEIQKAMNDTLKKMMEKKNEALNGHDQEVDKLKTSLKGEQLKNESLTKERDELKRELEDQNQLLENAHADLNITNIAVKILQKSCGVTELAVYKQFKERKGESRILEENLRELKGKIIDHETVKKQWESFSKNVYNQLGNQEKQLEILSKELEEINLKHNEKKISITDLCNKIDSMKILLLSGVQDDLENHRSAFQNIKNELKSLRETYEAQQEKLMEAESAKTHLQLELGLKTKSLGETIENLRLVNKENDFLRLKVVELQDKLIEGSSNEEKSVHAVDESGLNYKDFMSFNLEKENLESELRLANRLLNEEKSAILAEKVKLDVQLRSIKDTLHASELENIKLLQRLKYASEESTLIKKESIEAIETQKSLNTQLQNLSNVLQKTSEENLKTQIELLENQRKLSVEKGTLQKTSLALRESEENYNDSMRQLKELEEKCTELKTLKLELENRTQQVQIKSSEIELLQEHLEMARRQLDQKENDLKIDAVLLKKMCDEKRELELQLQKAKKVETLDIEQRRLLDSESIIRKVDFAIQAFDFKSSIAQEVQCDLLTQHATGFIDNHQLHEEFQQLKESLKQEQLKNEEQQNIIERFKKQLWRSENLFQGRSQHIKDLESDGNKHRKELKKITKAFMEKERNFDELKTENLRLFRAYHDLCNEMKSKDSCLKQQINLNKKLLEATQERLENEKMHLDTWKYLGSIFQEQQIGKSILAS